MAPTRTAGRLLVATPPLVDANFDRSVVLMVDHDEEGAVGVVLNRPGAQSLPEPLDRWGDLLSPPTVLFHGGPVSPETLLALGSARNRDSETALHPSCTTRIGTDGLAVLDPDSMRVHGTDGLRVVDAGCMPNVSNGNTYAPTMMIAEKAADLILGRTPLPPDHTEVHRDDSIASRRR